MAAFENGSLQSPRHGQLIADLTDGTHTLSTGAAGTGDVWQANGTAPYAGATYALDSNGFMMTLDNSAAAGNYASFAYAPASPMDLSASDFIAIEYDFPEGDASWAGQFNDHPTILVVTSPRTPHNTYTNYKGPTTYISGADKVPHRMVLVARFSEMSAGAGTLNTASITRIEVRFTRHASSTSPSKLYIRKIWAGRNRPQIMLTLDDAYTNQRDWLADQLAAYGFAATIYPSPRYFGVSGRLTTTKLLQLVNTYGWSVGLQQYWDAADQPIASGTITRSGTTGTFTPSTQQINPYIAAQIAAGLPITFYASQNAEWNTSFASAGASVSATTGIITFTCAGTETTPSTGITYCQRLPKALAQQKFSSVISYLGNLGISLPYLHFGPSGGQTADLTWPWWVELGGVTCRTSASGTSATGKGGQYGFDPRISSARSLMHLPVSIMDQTTAATQLSRLDVNLSHGLSMIFVNHDNQSGVGTGTALTMDQAEWSAFLAALYARKQAGLCDVITMDEFYRRLTYMPRRVG